MLRDDITALEHGAMNIATQLKRQIGRMLDPYRDAVELFCDPETGELKPAAVRWLARLAAENYVDRSTFDADPRVHALREGQRRLALKIMNSVRLDTGKLARLRHQQREVDDG